MSKHEWLKNLALMSVATLLALLVAEGMVRLVWRSGGQERVIQADPVLGWSLHPGTRLHSVDTDRRLDYAIQVNSLGMRDPEPRGLPAEYRVLLLGDSMMFGTGVPVGERCGDLLRQQLGVGTDVLNASVGGWGTDQEFLYLRQRGLDLQPDVVILGLCMSNDVVNNMLPHEFLGSAPKPRFVLQQGQLVLEPLEPWPPPTTRQKLKHLAQRSRLLHYLGRHALLLRQRLEGDPEPQPQGSTPYYPEDLESSASHWSIYETPYQERFDRAFHVTEALIAAANDSCVARGIPFVLFAWPQKVEVDSVAREHELRHHGFDPDWFDLSAPYEQLQQLADRLDIPFVYPLDAFRNASTDTPLYFARDPHPNVAGHKLAAQALMPVVSNALHDKGNAARTAHRKRE